LSQIQGLLQQSLKEEAELQKRISDRMQLLAEKESEIERRHSELSEEKKKRKELTELVREAHQNLINELSKEKLEMADNPFTQRLAHLQHELDEVFDPPSFIASLP